jgi:hypothetical protein
MLIKNLNFLFVLYQNDQYYEVIFNISLFYLFLFSIFILFYLGLRIDKKKVFLNNEYFDEFIKNHRKERLKRKNKNK